MSENELASAAAMDTALDNATKAVDRLVATVLRIDKALSVVSERLAETSKRLAEASVAAEGIRDCAGTAEEMHAHLQNASSILRPSGELQVRLLQAVAALLPLVEDRTGTTKTDIQAILRGE